MRLLLILIGFFASLSIAQKTVNYNGEELKVYPFDQKVELNYYHGSFKTKSGEKIKKSDRLRYQWDNGVLNKELFIPLGTIEDGKYIQFANPKIKDYIDLDWDIINNVNYKIPFAILSVKDNKLNGEAIYLDVNGDTLIKGEFRDNLYTGTWYVGRRTKDYFTYEKGEKNGAYYAHSYKYGKKKKYYSVYIENGRYKNGILMEYERKDSGLNYLRVLKKTAINEGINEATYTEHVNGVLREKGNRIDYHPVGDWHYFNSEGGIEKEAQFFSDSVSLGRSLEEWSEGLSNHPYWFGSIIFDAIHVKRSRSYFSSHSVSRYSSRGYKTALCFGEEQFYYRNGQKHFSYKIKDNEFVPDTVFNDNGTPSYFMHKDERTREFVLSYFDFDGHKIDEARVPFEQDKSDPEYVMMYRGLELQANFLLNGYGDKTKISEDVVFYYDNQSSYEDLVAAGDTTFYTYIAHDGNDLIAETYFIFEEHVRIEKRYNFKGEESLYERRDYFNDDFTACHSVINSDFGNGFEVHEEFDLVLKNNFFLNYQYQIQPKYRTRLLSINNEFFPTERGIRSRDNFQDNFIDVRNYQVDYLMYNKPFTGKLDLEFNTRKTKLKVSDKKLKAKFYDNFNDVTNDQYYVADRFGINRTYSGFALIPNLFSDIPRSGATALSKTGKVTGAFLNGEKTGDWVYKHHSGKKICELSYENNKAQGELISHYFQYKTKERYTHYWGAEGGLERQYYVSSKANFEDGQISTVHSYNIDGLEIGSYEYKDGKPASAAYYNTQHLFEMQKITDSVYLEVRDNELSKLHLSFFDDEMNVEKEKKYSLKNEEFDGLYVDELDSGNFENGKFTGIFSNGIGYDRIKKEYIKNGLLTRIEYLSPDGYKLLEVRYDTISIKLTGSLGRRYYLASDVKLSAEDTLLSDPTSKLFADFKSFYSNGQVHAEGEISNNPMSGKTNVWRYYNPEGELVSMIAYLNTFDQEIEENQLKNFGSLVQFENGNAIYAAEIIEILAKYNCAAADNYEVRQIRVLEDYKNGDTIPYPTRYHKSYFDMGVLQSEGQLVNGIPDGVWKFYDREGGLTAVGKYVKGKREGRWISGDLTGLGFIGDFCLATDDYVLSKETLQKNVNLIITFYENGEASKPKVIEASRND